MGADARDMKTMNDGQVMEMKTKDKNDAINERTPVSQSRQLIRARHINKLAKGDNPVFLAIVRSTNEAPQEKKSNKRSSAYAAQFTAAHGMFEGQRRSINKSQSPKKDIISVAE